MSTRWFFLSACTAALLLAGCDFFAPAAPGIGKAVDWDELAGWADDHHGESWPALVSGCRRLEKDPTWSEICAAAGRLDQPGDPEARTFYETWFRPHPVHAEGGKRTGLITGYYEPLLNGSRQRNDRFRYPLFGRPDDLLTVDLAELFPELKGKRVRGRLKGNRVVPYLDRAALDAEPDALAGQELLWVDDPVAVFFLHIQGSGRVRLPDGTVVGVGYADQNGHPYRSIGAELIRMGELTREDVTMFSIRDWLRENPQRVGELFNRNPSYVFFTLRESPAAGPVGSLNVPLTPQRSIAVDRKVITLGSPVWLETSLPGSEEPYRRLVFAQDTGGAISGHVRADLFWGLGENAEKMAGLMKQQGRLFVLLPKEPKGI